MGKGECIDATNIGPSSKPLHTYTWEEIKRHRTNDSKWIVVDGQVYDITTWQRKHPGGARILDHFAGQDATEVWFAMHTDKARVSKFMKPLLVGQLQSCKTKQDQIYADFREMRQTVAERDLFKVDKIFFTFHLAHIIALEVLAYYILTHFSMGWTTYLVLTVILTTAQAQAGWTQHDYGHLSVFRSSRVNHWMHYFVIGHFKAASSHWWNFRHFQHHAKPNILGKDPDVNAAYLFLLGEETPKSWGKKKRGFMPYQWQHDYFWILGPPILLPVYFHLENLYFVFKRRDWVDFVWMMSYFVRYFSLYGPVLGYGSAFGLYMFMRLLESFWFTFVTQMNHIPMTIEKDKEYDWLTSQLISTCNVDQSFFNDWFTGHLNFQIEHHLFPTMPRHNYVKVAPLVKKLCEKHNLPYVSKPLGTALIDILRSLKKSGSIWYDAYYQR